MAKSLSILTVVMVGLSWTSGLSTEGAEGLYIDGTLVSSDVPSPIAAEQPVVVDSFPSHAPSYSMGLTFDGASLWNDDGFAYWFAQIDTSDGSLIGAYTPSSGNRDMGWDGNWLWATDWLSQYVHKYDPSNCSIVYSFFHPFSGRPDGVTWDGEYLWIGEEGGRIWQVDTLGIAVRSIPAPNSSYFNPRGLAWDGEYLWVGCQTIGLIYKVDPADGAIISSFASPSGELQQGLAFDGQYLWSTGGDDWIYRIDIGVGVEELTNDQLPITKSQLLQNYPNPFTHTTTIQFSISNFPPEADSPQENQFPVSLKIYDLSGKLVKALVDGSLPAPYLSRATCPERSRKKSRDFPLPTCVVWDGRDQGGREVPGGIYLYRLQTGNQTSTKKVVLIR